MSVFIILKLTQNKEPTQRNMTRVPDNHSGKEDCQHRGKTIGGGAKKKKSITT